MNNCLRLISGSKPLFVNPTDGQETLAGAADLFRYIDSNFEHWNCNTVGPATKETAVQVHQIVRDSTFQEMFGSFGVTVDCLALTLAQIKQFAKRYPDWLKKGGNGTFFLFKTGNEFFCVSGILFLGWSSWRAGASSYTGAGVPGTEASPAGCEILLSVHGCVKNGPRAHATVSR
jgi:hypothetical protein